MVLTEIIQRCLHFIVIREKKYLSHVLLPLPIPLCGLYILLIDLLCHVLILNCAEYSTNRPPVTLACRDALLILGNT